MSRRNRILFAVLCGAATVLTGIAWWGLVDAFGEQLTDDPYSPYEPVRVVP